MTGFSAPPDPDGDPAENDRPATAPMTPDEPGRPEHDSVSPAFDDAPDPDAPATGDEHPSDGA